MDASRMAERNLRCGRPPVGPRVHTTHICVLARLPDEATAASVARVKPSAAVLVLLAAFALAACGGASKQDKAKAQVCDARADISKQVDTLKGLTLTTATKSKIQSGLKAIRDDLTTIKNAEGDLNDQRKKQVQQANQAFKTQVKDVTSTLGSTTSIQDARAQLTEALQQLAKSYQTTFAKVDCS
jgi:hypothetical protein